MAAEIDVQTERQLAAVGSWLRARGKTLVAAESCTGGLLAAKITDHPGCSAWFRGSFVTYQTQAKRSMLGIPERVLRAHPPVSRHVAVEMAARSLELSGADSSVALTGLAGPDRDESNVPVGTLWVAWGQRDCARIEAERFEVHADRRAFREHACFVALQGLLLRLPGEGDQPPG